MLRMTSRALGNVSVLIACCVVAALVAGVALRAEQRTGETQSGGERLRIAVVDIGQLLHHSREWADCEQKHKMMLDTMNRTLRKLERQVLVLRSECENLAPGTEAMTEKKKQIEDATREFQEAQRRFQNDIAKTYNASVRKISDRIVTAVEGYAKANGIDLVLKKHRLNSPRFAPSQAELLLAGTDVLYSDEDLDVTEQIVALLNADYPSEIEVR